MSPPLLLASGPAFTLLDIALILAFFANMYVGPASAVFLLVALAVRKGLDRSLRVVAVINLILGTISFMMGELLPLFTCQLILWCGVLYVLSDPALHRRFFGEPTPYPEAK